MADEASNNVLGDIGEAINSWSQRLLDIESRLKKTQTIQEKVANSLKRQVLDGLISESDSYELEYTTDLWLSLYKAYLCKHQKFPENFWWL